MRIGSIALCLLLVVASACNAYDRARYRSLIDGGDTTLTERADIATEDGAIVGDTIDAPDSVPPTDASDANDAIGTSDVLQDASCPVCGANEDCCGTRCVDVRFDTANCGRCGNVCPGTTCSAGSCTGTCVLGRLDCDGNIVNGCEIDAATDRANCGSCGRACSTGRSCDAGSCVCAAGTLDCDGNPTNGCEVSTVDDAANCGACGRTCGANQTCAAGACGCAAGFADCDGNASNGCERDTRSDGDHCGSCGTSCGASGHCTAGLCECDPGWLHCGSTPGCTVSTADVSNCGACGNACAGATPYCSANVCVAACPTGQVQCSGSCTDASDPLHCGSCSNMCGARPNAVPVCAAGACRSACDPGFGDCNAVDADGCEADVRTDRANCGSCGRACGASQICSGGACTCPAGLRDCGGGVCAACCVNADCNDGSGCTNDVCSGGVCTNAGCAAGTMCCGMAACATCCSDADCSGMTGHVGCGTDGRCSTCAAGYTNCDGLATNGCEAQLTTDASNCGACGRVCSFAQARASCVAGACTLGACVTGYADCDRLPATGCETDLQSDNANCGGCGTACLASQVCTGGMCVTSSCPAGLANCDGLASNGCEANLNADPANCGTCANGCLFANASAACASALCTLGACTPGFGNCDTNIANGCETALSVSIAHCGACNNPCSYPFASATCVAGVCAMGTCASGRGNCDGSATNGCETDLNLSVSHCGMCGLACAAAPNAVATCAVGTCGYACNPGFGDCDTSQANGCETALTTITNCGACGRTCSTGQLCLAGTCAAPTIGGESFRITAMTTTACYWREHRPLTGDDRGGIAISPSRLIVSGDDNTATFAATGLDPGASITSTPAVHDGLLQNLRDGTVYVLLDATGTEVVGPTLAGSFTVTQLGVLDGTTGSLTTARVPLTTPIAVTEGSGIFSGWDRAVIWNGTRAYHVALPAGTVVDVGAMAFPTHTSCENWAFWGTVEFYGGTLYVDYVRSYTSIARTSVPSGFTTTIGTFSDLGDMCEFTFSPARSRWYWHNEHNSMFSSGGNEISGFCAGTWDQPGAMCPAGTTTCATSCHTLAVDDTNCGTCGATCAAGSRCIAGSCAVGCPSGSILCGLACTNISTDVNNCAECGGVCASVSGGTRTCSDAYCGNTCPVGATLCATACSTLVGDAQNCGVCGRVCGIGQVCLSGNCTPTTCGFSGYFDCNGMPADGCEVDSRVDPNNCGMCGHACGSGQGCIAGVCVACNGATAPRVLAYGPTWNSTSAPLLPAGAILTVASSATWRTMTPSNFSAYNLIVIESSGTASNYQAAYDTRAIWSPAVTGRVLVLGSDVDDHLNEPGAVTFLTASFAWLSSGPGTAIYIGSDKQTRALDFAQSVGAFVASYNAGDGVVIVPAAASHPVMVGSTNASLSNWYTTYHTTLTAIPSDYTVLADAQGSPGDHVAVARGRVCRP